MGSEPTTMTCIRGCRAARQHATDCEGDECRGCLPRPASHGLLCYPCHYRLRELLQVATVQHGMLLATAGKSDEQTFTVETVAKTHQPPRTSSDGKFPAPYAKSVTVAMSQSEPVRLAALDAAQALSDWLSQVTEAVVQHHQLTGPRRLRTAGDRREWKWHPVAEDGAASDYDPLVKIGHGREATWGQYILTEPPATFAVNTAAHFLLAWLDRLEAMEFVGDEFDVLAETMSQCHALAPWREQMARLTGIPCPACHANALARFGGDENVTCIRCNESIPPERYGLWIRMLHDEHVKEGA